MKYIRIIILIFVSSNLNAQIVVDKFDMSIESELPDTLQRLYEQFITDEVERISIIHLEKSYDHSEYYYFLRNKKFFQSRKKWLKNNSFEGSIIMEDQLDITKLDSTVFEFGFNKIDVQFIKSEFFLDSTEVKLALNEMFNGKKNSFKDFCYMPRHAVLFYNEFEEVIGIYEICFQCSNVKFGIIGTKMVSKSSPYIETLFEKYKQELK